MSVASGKFFNDKMSFVGGAPRANGVGMQSSLCPLLYWYSCRGSFFLGQVVFYNKRGRESTFVVEQILDGEQFAASFGYSLASIDCNGDK